MNTNKNYFDLIDAYLNGEMTSHEAIEFESQLHKDPLLENEFQLQKDIVNSIRNFREVELKATLDAVDVGVGSTFTALKVAAVIGIVALLGLGVYHFTGDSVQPKADQTGGMQAVVENQLAEEPKSETTTNTLIEGVHKPSTGKAVVKEENTATREIEKPPSKTGEPVEEKAQPIVREETTTVLPEAKKAEQPQIKLPEVIEEFDKGEGQISENIKVPENKLNKVTETYLPKTEVVEMNHRKYSFHYQFYNNKLYLYGEFDNKYEILELNTPAGISIYMFYRDKFYELEQNQEKITPLQAIQNSALMRDLKTIREN